MLNNSRWTSGNALARAAIESPMAFPRNFVPEGMSYMYPSSEKKETNFSVSFPGPSAAAWSSVMRAGARQRLSVSILPDVRQFAIFNGNGENPIVLERFIRGYDFPPSEADDQNPVSLRNEFKGL